MNLFPWHFNAPVVTPAQIRPVKLLLTATALCLLATSQAMAQPADKAGTHGTASTKPMNTAPGALDLSKAFSGLDWGALTSTQRATLQPLQTHWHELSEGQRRKWLRLSANYDQMPPAQQTRLHERMTQWAALKPNQREAARINFVATQRLAPKTKSEQWRAYQALSAEEKNKLAMTAKPTPPRTALAVKPAPAGRLNRVPLAKAKAPPTRKKPAISPPNPAVPAPDNTPHESVKP